MLVYGDSVVIGGKTVGTIAGFDESHFPNHYNIVIKGPRRLSGDHTSMFWIRAGAIAGVIAVAVQSVWDTGLRTPANGVLFAVIVAVAVHEPRIHSASSRPRSAAR